MMHCAFCFAIGIPKRPSRSTKAAVPAATGSRRPVIPGRRMMKSPELAAQPLSARAQGITEARQRSGSARVP
jgi:hypothetical protein